jgi:hypothetical protein
MAVDCVMTKGKIQMFGFGIPSKGFYAIEIPEPRVYQIQTAGIVIVLEGEADEDKLNEELRLVVNDKWDFKPRMMTRNEFLVVFPDKGTLETFSRFAGFNLSIYNLKVQIVKSNVDPTTSSVLQTCWVRISNIPPIAREESVVRELASLVGQPVVVDELSLIREEHVRVKVNCRDPLAIRCVIEIFFNKVGHEVELVLEGSLGMNLDTRGSLSGSGSKDKKSRKKDRGDAGNSKKKKKSDKFDRFGNVDKEQDSSYGGSQDAMEQDDLEQVKNLPISAYHPNCGVMKVTTLIKDNLVNQHVWDPADVMIQQSAISEQQKGFPKDAYVVQNQEEKLKSVGESEEQVIQKKDMCDLQFFVQGGMDTYLMDKRQESELITTEYVAGGDGESLDKISQLNHINGGPQSYEPKQKVVDSNQESKLIAGVLDDDEAGELGIVTQESEVEFGDMDFFHDDDMTEDLEQTWISSSKKKAKKKTEAWW